MAIALDQANLGGNNAAATATTITLTLANAIASGGTAVFVVSFDGATTTVTGSGGSGTYTSHVTQMNGTLGLTQVTGYFAAGCASSTVLTFTFGATRTNRAVTGTSFTGIEGSGSPLHASAAATGSALGHSTGNVTVTAGEVVVGTAVAWTQGAGGNTPTAPSLESKDYQAVSADKYLNISYRIEGSSGSVPVAGAWASSVGGATVDIGCSYLAAAAGGATVRLLGSTGVGT